MNAIAAAAISPGFVVMGPPPRSAQRSILGDLKPDEGHLHRCDDRFEVFDAFRPMGAGFVEDSESISGAWPSRRKQFINLCVGARNVSKAVFASWSCSNGAALFRPRSWLMRQCSLQKMSREGINLQHAHLMVNYDLPWNPNPIEQRSGRIHRIGQTEVCHLWNFIAEETSDGEVYLHCWRS
jgi:Helicase conserved C-terminal domain